ncbi:MAG: acyl-CoA dehydratase activase-related protein [Endomicrobium sp.]|nr:acyl-CoA dehydratase activase-related protein [Endomicrobium sp.]
MKEIKGLGKSTVILAGRPYHIDSAINHDVADLIASQGMIVLTEDSVAHLSGALPKINFVNQ